MIKSLTSLRGIFILFIFFHHAGIYPGGGSMAVVFFFVLSGFSMTLGYKDKVFHPNFNYKLYLSRRCAKFFPLHWITLVADIPLVLMSTLHWWLIPLFFVNAALLQTIIPIDKIYFSYNAVSWFLADILFFSVLFPFVFKRIAVMTNKQKGVMAIIGMLVYVAVLIGTLYLPESIQKGIIYISPFVRITDFVFGILLGLDYIKLKENQRLLININKHGDAIFVLLIGIIILLVAESFILGSKLTLVAPLYWPLVAILIYLAALPNETVFKWLNNKVLIRLGECSFTIFLVHRLVLRYISKLLHFDNKILYVLFCLIITIIVSIIVEKYILTPITQWLTKRNQPFMTVRS